MQSRAKRRRKRLGSCRPYRVFISVAAIGQNHDLRCRNSSNGSTVGQFDEGIDKHQRRGQLGIPAVVGCGNATMLLKTGDRVRVDGGSGTVDVIERVG